MLFDIFLIIVGFIALLGGADMCVRGASRIAEQIGISKALIGLTVVAFGTSLPELVVSLLAAWKGEPGIAVGNVIGSNIANITLILGTVALITPLVVDRTIIKRELPLMIVSAILILYFASTGYFTRLEGLILLGAFGFFMWLSLGRFQAEFDADHEKGDGSTRRFDILLTLGGFVFLMFGGDWVVDGAKSIAHSFGVTEWMIGLTVVALGTSLPELATSLVAAYRKELDISMGNLVGSNLFNSFFILGGAMLIKPAVVGHVELSRDIIIMVFVSLLVYGFSRSNFRISRLEGAILLVFYLSFMASLIIRPTWCLY